MHHSLGQDCSSRSTVTGYIVRLGSDFSDQLCSHVLESVFQFDLFRDRDTVVRDQRRAE